MPKPKSPLDKPSSSRSRRPPPSRRSSSEKSPKSSTDNHGINAGRSSLAKTKDSMPDHSVGEQAPPRSEDSDLDKGKGEGEAAGDSQDSGLQQGSVGYREGAERALANSQTKDDQGRGPHMEYRRGETAANISPEDLDHLRSAITAQGQLNEHRERLAKHLGERDGRENTALPAKAGKARVSPIDEEKASSSATPDAYFSTPLQSTWEETPSTESARTVRGGATPSVASVRTPSYPFPPMRTPRQLSYTGHRPFTALSPTVNPENFAGGSFDGTNYDRVMSGSVTSGSNLTFQPSFEPQEDPNLASPNLYDLSLMLSAEPGLDPWWTTVVQIMRDVYKADRVTLSVPADSTDIENVPWGQKATFDAAEGDELSLTYLQRGSSLVPSSVDTNDTSTSDDTNKLDDSSPLAMSMIDPLRPGIPSRHSFTTYEESKRVLTSTSEAGRAAAARPTSLARAKSYLSARPDQPPRSTTLQSAEHNLQSLADLIESENAELSPWGSEERPAGQLRGRVFPVLQALDYENEPLIDSSGILRVLERGKVIALTRDYPYLESQTDESSGGSKPLNRSGRSKESLADKVKKGKTPELRSRISSFLGSKSSRRSSRSARSQGSDKDQSMPMSSRGQEDMPPPPPKYEEYEQSPPSPWSKSPAASPAVRAETSENPFFMNASVDEETFKPSETSEDYSKMQQCEAIGIDRSWTVLHIPLIHPLLSKPVQSFRLDTAAMESKSADGTRGDDQMSRYLEPGRIQGVEQGGGRRTPIAILSILTPVIPYPSNQRRSLEHLAPHLATSFSLCRHYSNLEMEVAGLSRKRPQTAGFGAVARANHRIDDQMKPGYSNYPLVDEAVPHQSGAGSMTSPSDYSAMSRSAAGSPIGTPGWELSNVGFSTRDKRSSGGSGGSPAYSTGDGYFSSWTRPALGRVNTDSAVNVLTARQPSKDASPVDARSQQPSRNVQERLYNAELPGREEIMDTQYKLEQEGMHSSLTSPIRSNAIRHDRASPDLSFEPPDMQDTSPPRERNEARFSPRRQAMRTASNQGSTKEDKSHTLLHSYGADFGATFQSLPTTSTPYAKNSTSTKMSRGGSISLPTDMPPPSDRLKGLMLDSLPAHVFVALPQTGEIVWVNSRYLTYRGQTVPQLHQDPWGSIHPDERDEYLKAWTHAIRTGEQFSMQVRIRRFDGTYRWFYTRAVGSRDFRGVIVQWYGSHMDIHDQHIAEVKAARQEEIEASEAKHRQLANLIPQIIFAATEDEGVTFANEQWLSYTGQEFNDALGLGFIDYVHPADLAKCQIPIDRPPTASKKWPKKPFDPDRQPSQSSSAGNSSSKSSNISEAVTENTVKGVHQALSRNNSSSSESVYELPSADLSELTRNGVVKVGTDSNGRPSYSTEVRLRSKAGEYRWHLVRCVQVDNISLGSGDGSWFGACTDINDHKLLETKLKEAMDSKSRFLSNMSHEIRTPLIGISGMISFLQDTVLNDEQIDYTTTIQSSASSLLNIINDILDLSKVDAGMMKLSSEWFHTRSLVEEVNEMVSTMAITKRLELNYIVDEDVPEMVMGDKFRIRQVLLNVIGNAIKFTTTGEVFSRCRVYDGKAANVGENEIMLEYSIIDTGSGFTQEEADLIFKPFGQIDGSSTRQHGGSGLGLVISRQLVELHGGKMEGCAVPGEGSTFTFTAKFGLPTAKDHPESPLTPQLSNVLTVQSSVGSSVSSDILAQPLTEPSGNPILANKLVQSPPADSPRTESSGDSAAVASSGSSEPSLRSFRSHVTQSSSTSSIAQNLAHFSEAAQASGSDLSHMKLALPERRSPSSESGESTSVMRSGPGRLEAAHMSSAYGDTLSRHSSTSSVDFRHLRPPLYSILVVCPQTRSREATVHHIETTLPKDVPHQITPLSSAAEAQQMIGGNDPVIFTHIVLSLGSTEEIVTLIDQIVMSISLPQTSIIVLSDPVQRQEVIKLADAYDYNQLAQENRVTFIYKPVKPSRFAVIFDPDKERNLSIDRNRSSAQQQVANQKQNYVEVRERLGNKGYNVLLVEDNLVNQKVLLKYLSKVGIAVEVASDGVECIEKVFSRAHSFFSLILCDLHMPRKDGYQTCREIREWEKRESLPPLPIIALTANVMADVRRNCIQAGFNSYVTKPYDFKSLSIAMGNLLDPVRSKI